MKKKVFSVIMTIMSLMIIISACGEKSPEAKAESEGLNEKYELVAMRAPEATEYVTPDVEHQGGIRFYGQNEFILTSGADCITGEFTFTDNLMTLYDEDGNVIIDDMFYIDEDKTLNYVNDEAYLFVYQLQE